MSLLFWIWKVLLCKNNIRYICLFINILHTYSFEYFWLIFFHIMSSKKNIAVYYLFHLYAYIWWINRFEKKNIKCIWKHLSHLYTVESPRVYLKRSRFQSTLWKRVSKYKDRHQTKVWPGLNTLEWWIALVWSSRRRVLKLFMPGKYLIKIIDSIWKISKKVYAWFLN